MPLLSLDIRYQEAGKCTDQGTQGVQKFRVLVRACNLYRHLCTPRALRKHSGEWSFTIPTACIHAYTITGPTNLNPRFFKSAEIVSDSGVFAGSQAQWEKITVPLFTVGNWSGMGLHLRGNTEAFMRAGSKHKKLGMHSGTHVHPFYTEDGLTQLKSRRTIGRRTHPSGSADRRAGEHVAREVHAGVHPGVRDRTGEREHRRRRRWQR